MSERFRRTVTRGGYEDKAIDYPEWQKGYEFNGIVSGDVVEENGTDSYRIHRVEFCERIS